VDPLAEKILREVPDGSTVKVTGGTNKLLFLPRVDGGDKKVRRRRRKPPSTPR
jgi:hypothetical protein